MRKYVNSGENLKGYDVCNRSVSHKGKGENDKIVIGLYEILRYLCL